MKKILYLLLLSTMVVYFTGCEEKGDEIDNTTSTSESVEITEANILGKWSCYKFVEYYEGEEEVYEYGSGEYEYYTFNADGTYKTEVKEKDEETNEYVTETSNGTWELKGMKLTWLSGDTWTIKTLTNKEMVLRYEDVEEGDWEDMYLKKI